ncbi:MAG: PspC domain-containing protein [Spirochaetales bacterium]|nr:PspC domain-containing protein [Spirochaetales bacterium]
MTGSFSGSRRLYRSRDAEILGVCQGIADWRDFPVHLVRWGFILLAIFTVFMPVLIGYFILGVILPLEPEYRKRRRKNRGHYYEEANDISAEFEDLKERVDKMEDAAFDREQDWEERFRKNR